MPKILVSRESIKIDGAFLQKYFAGNEVYEYVFKNYILTSAKKDKFSPSQAHESLNRAMNEFTLQSKRFQNFMPEYINQAQDKPTKNESTQINLSCTLFRKFYKSHSILLEIKNEGDKNTPQSMTRIV